MHSLNNQSNDLTDETMSNFRRGDILGLMCIRHMKGQIIYTKFEPLDFEPLLTMSQKLWPDLSENVLKSLIKKSTKSHKNLMLIAKIPQKTAVGFSIFSIRTDYVEGADKSPTGYLEGIFVEPGFRKRGIAREFMRQGEKWCREQGCTQIGSDTWLTNDESRAFHKKVGFWEEDELVHFLKYIQ